MDRGPYLKSGPYSILHTFRVLWTTFPNVDRFFTVKNRWSIFGKDESGPFCKNVWNMDQFLK